jgi:hypothetical protein
MPENEVYAYRITFDKGVRSYHIYGPNFEGIKIHSTQDLREAASELSRLNGLGVKVITDHLPSGIGSLPDGYRHAPGHQ